MTTENDILESVIGFDALYNSMYQCRKSVGWKDSTAHYCLNGIEETIKLERQLKSGSYKARPQKKIQITHPKPREAVSIAFRDRVYQRSLNDNIIYPAMSKSFIRANAACQKGKGTDFARDMLDRYLREVYRKHGLKAYVLQCDIKGYYPSMRHDVAENCFRKHLPAVIYQKTEEVLRNQYGGDVGYNPGSQMIQIAGISVLSPMDHFIKERLRVRWYLRYMDDFILIHHDQEHLEACRKEIERYLSGIGLTLHPTKTRIYPIKNGIKMIGFTHRLTATGKVIRLIDPKNVKAERKKLYRMVQKAKRGELPRKKVDECFKSWKAHAHLGNCHKLIHRMNLYYTSLWKEVQKNDHRKQTQRDYPGAEESG